ncbi:MAG: hypothetical protein ACYDC7_07975 [Acidithiobacillus ferrivorans]
MNEGAQFQIFNLSEQPLKLLAKDSYQLNGWEFDTVQSNYRRAFYIEFQEGIGVNTGDTQAHATYGYESNKPLFKIDALIHDIKVHHPGNYESPIIIGTSEEGDENKFIWSPLHKDSERKMGWHHDSVMTILVLA